MSGRKPPSDSRARRILERLAGSAEFLNESLSDAEELADGLQQIEQLFLLHGGERKPEASPDALFSWGHLQALERVGEGSFGEVFRAYDEILDRDVALKLLKADQDRPFQAQLFLHEARQLAMVRHPNVLAVHGAAIHDGRPGLWSDLIEGRTLPADGSLAASLSETDWLDLIESLVRGLAAVHEAGLIHGDVKPSNIMRDASGTWVLMDFGASLDRKPGREGPAMVSGTPLYMAPELVKGESASPASDAYSLGATLYRAATGRPPLEATDWDALRALHQDGASIDPRPLKRALPTALARLIGAMLARDPAERPTESELLAAIEAIRSAPHRRFRRLAIGAITSVLLLGLVFTSVGFYRANEARLEAEREQRNTAAVSDFLRRVLATPDSTGRARDVTVEDMLDHAAEAVDVRLQGQPLAQAAVHRALAESYNVIGLHERALEQTRFGLERLAGSDAETRLLGQVLELEAIAALEGLDQHQESLDRATAFIAEHRRSLQEDHWHLQMARKYQITNLLAMTRYDEAGTILEAHFEDIPAPETASNNLGFEILHARGNLRRELGDYDGAIEAARTSLDWLDRHPQARPANRASALVNLSLALKFSGQPQAALEALDELLTLQGRLYGEGSEAQLSTLVNYSAIQYDMGDHAAALATQERARAMIEASPQLVPEQYALTLEMNRANLLNAAGRVDEGEALIRELLVRAADLLGPEHLNVLILEYNLAELLNQLGRYDEALALSGSTTERMISTLGEGHPFRWLSESNHAQSLAGLGQSAESLALHDRAETVLSDMLGPMHGFTLTARRQALESRQRIDPSTVSQDEIIALIEDYAAQSGPRHPDTEKARALLRVD